MAVVYDRRYLPRNGILDSLVKVFNSQSGNSLRIEEEIPNDCGPCGYHLGRRPATVGERNKGLDRESDRGAVTCLAATNATPAISPSFNSHAKTLPNPQVRPPYHRTAYPVRPGKNELEIEVVSGLWNYAAGMEKPNPIPKELHAQYGATASKTYRSWETWRGALQTKKNDTSRPDCSARSHCVGGP